MSNTTSFEITRFKNRNGSTASWRVSGCLHGVRIRKNFKSLDEAAAEKNVLRIRAAQAATGLRPATTFLADPQLREAEDAFRRLDGKNHSLLFYLDYALATFREPQQQKPLHEAVEEYVAGKQKEYDRSLLSSQQLRAIKNELKILRTCFPTGPVSQLTAANLTTFMERGDPALKTYNNRRGLVSTFCKFAFQKDWPISNPIEKTPHHRINHRRGSAVTRDGLMIEGYVTFPANASKEHPAPLLVFLHGGPWQIRESWSWAPAVQFFVSHGYAVFVPNYRGSLGYDSLFALEDRFDFQKMSNDVSDGIGALTKTGLVDSQARRGLWGWIWQLSCAV